MGGGGRCSEVNLMKWGGWLLVSGNDRIDTRQQKRGNNEPSNYRQPTSGWEDGRTYAGTRIDCRRGGRREEEKRRRRRRKRRRKREQRRGRKTREGEEERGKRLLLCRGGQKAGGNNKDAADSPLPTTAAAQKSERLVTSVSVSVSYMGGWKGNYRPANAIAVHPSDQPTHTFPHRV